MVGNSQKKIYYLTFLKVKQEFLSAQKFHVVRDRDRVVPGDDHLAVSRNYRNNFYF